MRLVDFETSRNMKKAVDRSIALYYSVIVGVIAMFFGFAAGFGAGIVTGIVVFVLLFVLVYGILSMQTNGVYRRIQKLTIENPYLEVSYLNEQGILIFHPQVVMYKTMIVGATNKEFSLPVNEDLFMGFGEFKQKKRHQYKYGGYKRCHITFREMPHGFTRQFRFFDVDGSLDKVEEMLNSINQFNLEKYS